MKLFEEGLPIFRGNLHAHTTCSDGALTPQQVMALYQKRGYDFLALTDHWRPNQPEWYGNMLVLSGVEMDAQLPDQVVHIVAVGLKGALPDWAGPGIAPRDMARAAREGGGRAILCHPAWSLNTPQVILGLQGVAGVEIYNSFSGIPWNAPRADSSIQVDLAFTQGFRAALVASDDAHRYTGEAGLASTWIQARDLTREALLEGLDKGACYASQGPAFRQITWDRGQVEVECSPVDTIVFLSNLPWSRERCRRGRDMTGALYQMRPGETYVRVELIDRYGRRAWSGALCG